MSKIDNVVGGTCDIITWWIIELDASGTIRLEEICLRLFHIKKDEKATFSTECNIIFIVWDIHYSNLGGNTKKKTKE